MKLEACFMVYYPLGTILKFQAPGQRIFRALWYQARNSKSPFIAHIRNLHYVLHLTSCSFMVQLVGRFRQRTFRLSIGRGMSRTRTAL